MRTSAQGDSNICLHSNRRASQHLMLQRELSSGATPIRVAWKGAAMFCEILILHVISAARSVARKHMPLRWKQVRGNSSCSLTGHILRSALKEHTRKRYMAQALISVRSQFGGSGIPVKAKMHNPTSNPCYFTKKMAIRNRRSFIGMAFRHSNALLFHGPLHSWFARSQ